MPRAGEAEHHVADLDAPAADDVVALDDADAEAGHVVIARLVEVGQDRRFAADQGAVGLHAAVADPFDEIARQGRVVLRHGEVVEEHQRLAARAKAIVDRHGDEVDADRVVLAGQRRDLELAADAVGAGNQDRMAIISSEQAGIVIEAEKAGEAADYPFPPQNGGGRQDARRVRPLEQGRHARQGLLVQVEVEAGGLVRQGRLVRHRVISAARRRRTTGLDIRRSTRGVLVLAPMSWRPRSAWVPTSGRSASRVLASRDAERPGTGSHAERGNQKAVACQWSGPWASPAGRVERGLVSLVSGGSGCSSEANNFSALSGC